LNKFRSNKSGKGNEGEQRRASICKDLSAFYNSNNTTSIKDNYTSNSGTKDVLRESMGHFRNISAKTDLDMFKKMDIDNKLVSKTSELIVMDNYETNPNSGSASKLISKIFIITM